MADQFNGTPVRLPAVIPKTDLRPYIVALLEQIPELNQLNLYGSTATVEIEFSRQSSLKTLTVQIAL